MPNRVLEGVGSLSFDCISQLVQEVAAPEMDERMETARNTAEELFGDQATEADALLFLEDFDDSFLADDFDPGTEEINGEETDQVQLPDQKQMHDLMEVAEQAEVSVVHFEEVKVDVSGFRELPHPDLANAGKGKEKPKLHKNNTWALKRADALRAALGWDMKIAFADLPLTKVDKLLANLFSRVVKLKGGEYPAESLMNMLGGYNRILRRASDVRSMTDPKHIPLGREFCIKKHPAFVRTGLTLDAAIKKTVKDGTNKKRKKVNHITQVMEAAVLADVDHQIYHNQGCQKRIAFYLLVRCGIRGGDELWELQRFDLAIKTDKNGKEYVQYCERHSKNNEYTLDRNKEEQFRRPYHSYEPDFILTTKQYLRHLPPWAEGNKDALFLGCIARPASIVWYNRFNKVGKGTSSGWLENMLKLVGLPAKLFSNKSGRATLITRLAAQGVPDEVGMLLSGHHTADGYGRYDCTKDLKQEAATMVAHSPGLDYQTALAEVSKRFMEEELVGSNVVLKPLIAHVSGGSGSNAIVSHDSEASCNNLTSAPVRSEASSSDGRLQVQAGKLLQNLQNQISKQIQDRPEDKALKVVDPAGKLAIWNEHYDGIDWDSAIRNDPKLAAMLGGGPRIAPIANNFSNCQNCTIQITLPPSFNPASFDWGKIIQNKENIVPK